MRRMSSHGLGQVVGGSLSHGRPSTPQAGASGFPDQDGNVTSATGPDDSTVIYRYDDDQNLAAVIGADGSRLSLAYDTAGRAASFTDQQGRNVQAQYDAVGNRTRLQWPANTNGSNAKPIATAGSMNETPDWQRL